MDIFKQLMVEAASKALSAVPSIQVRIPLDLKMLPHEAPNEPGAPKFEERGGVSPKKFMDVCTKRPI